VPLSDVAALNIVAPELNALAAMTAEAQRNRLNRWAAELLVRAS
jgi:predicted HicB family RNase H-like nuclease